MADSGSRVETGGIGLVTVILALVFLFYWPGPFRHQYTIRPMGIVKIDRITGEAKLLRNGKYEKILNLTDTEWKITTSEQAGKD